MRIKEITVGASRTINLGNYNSIKVEGRATIELEAGEDESPFIERAREKAIEEVRCQLKEAYTALQPPKKA
jgi:hypothetical protein